MIIVVIDFWVNKKKENEEMCGQKICVGFICVPKKRRVRENGWW